MQGIKRRIVYVTLFEGLAIVCSSVGLALVAGQELALAGAVAVTASVIAVVWNMLYNSLFERWEARQTVRTRGLGRRILHAVGFEAGMVTFMLPVFAYGLGITLAAAFVAQLGLLAFFLFYTFAFNLAFDRIFGLPKSAL